MDWDFEDNGQEWIAASTNEERADWAEAAVAEFRRVCSGDNDLTAIYDLIGNLGHLVDRLLATTDLGDNGPLDFEEVIEMGLMHYRAERGEGDDLEQESFPLVGIVDESGGRGVRRRAHHITTESEAVNMRAYTIFAPVGDHGETMDVGVLAATSTSDAANQYLNDNPDYPHDKIVAAGPGHNNPRRTVIGTWRVERDHDGKAYKTENIS